tara:strand:- start:446 stop:898 length:453 start_codon:yes stop_codon:yes gene_type:complete
MDEKVGNEQTSPPPIIIIQTSNPDNANETSPSPTFPGAEKNYSNNTVLIQVEGKPDVALLLSSLVMIGVSTAGFFFSIDSATDGEFLCCLLCNGNAIGLILLGVYCSKYGTWEKDSGKNGAGFFSQVIAGLLFCIAIVFFGLWITFISNF